MQNAVLSNDEIQDFKSSPLCTLSLSSKELFHTNMIGWLLQNHPEFGRELLDDGSVVKVSKVQREKLNFDLLVEANGRNYVIENKVKSLPDACQIDEYKMKASDHNLNALFILISLVPPDEYFTAIHPDVRIVSYRDIQRWISSVTTNNEYIKGLIADYGLLVSTLVRIGDFAAKMDFDDSISFNLENERLLKKVRLFDVAQKMRYACLAREVDRALDELRLPDLSRLKEKTEIGLTRSLGLMSIKFRLQDESMERPLLFGIQIQGSQYRLFIESADGSDVGVLAEDLKSRDLWLNPAGENRSKILKFGKVFKYSYSSIHGKKIGDIVRMIIHDVGRLFKNLDTLESDLSIQKRFLTEGMALGVLKSSVPSRVWSDSAKAQTREAIIEARLSPIDGCIHFKNLDNRFAKLEVQNLLNGHLRLTEKSTGRAYDFSNVEELISAGWVTD